MFCFLVQISLPSLIKLKASRMVIAYDIFSTKTCRAVPLIFFLFFRGGQGPPCLRTNQEPCKTCALHAKHATCEYQCAIRACFAWLLFCSVVKLFCGYRTKHMANRASYCRSKSYCQQKKRGNFLAIFASRNISLKHRGD